MSIELPSVSLNLYFLYDNYFLKIGSGFFFCHTVIEKVLSDKHHTFGTIAFGSDFGTRSVNTGELIVQ